jgi:hypothetical protein
MGIPQPHGLMMGIPRPPKILPGEFPDYLKSYNGNSPATESYDGNSQSTHCLMLGIPQLPKILQWEFPNHMV